MIALGILLVLLAAAVVAHGFAEEAYVCLCDRLTRQAYGQDGLDAADALAAVIADEGERLAVAA